MSSAVYDKVAVHDDDDNPEEIADQHDNDKNAVSAETIDLHIGAAPVGNEAEEIKIQTSAAPSKVGGKSIFHIIQYTIKYAYVSLV